MSYSLQAVPLLFFNLGGEMLYILEQRLHSQNVAATKSKKVFSDIMGLMFADRFVDDLFRPQTIYSHTVVRSIFNRLAHSSIMSLGRESMNKLFDLMMMVFKYQLEMCAGPRQLVDITVNHLDQAAVLTQSTNIKQLVGRARDQIVQVYGDMNVADLQAIRFILLNFLQDFCVRVSILLRSGAQNATGSFKLFIDGHLPDGVCVPGKLVLFDSRGEVRLSDNYPVTERVLPRSSPLAEQLCCRRHHCASLGCSIYPAVKDCQSADVSAANSSSNLDRNEQQQQRQCDEVLTETAAHSLQLLSRLIGQRTAPPREFQLNLFGSCDGGSVKSGGAVVDPRLDQVAREIASKPGDQDTQQQEDLLQLMQNVLK